MENLKTKTGEYSTIDIIKKYLQLSHGFSSHIKTCRVALNPCHHSTTIRTCITCVC